MRCYLKEYQQAIKQGTVRVSERQEENIDRLVDDMEKSTDWVYDTAEAHKRINFQERFVKQSKGAYVGRKIRLSLWQKAFWECVYSFKDRETGHRRFTEVLLLVARKNGKSTMMAGDAMYDLLLGQGISIACLSNTDKQSKLIWDEINNIRSQIDTKGTLTGKNLTDIYNRKQFNRVFRLTSKMTNLDGENISKAYFDECHECTDDAIYQAGIRSMSAQEEPLMILTTTAGFVRDGFLDRKVQHAHDVIDGTVTDDHFLPWLYEQDTEGEIWTDKDSWQKSNPALADGVKKERFLEQMVDSARVSAEDRTHTLTKDFNFPQNGASTFLSQTQLSIPQTSICIEDNDREVQGIGAVDLSRTTDVTCACFLYEDSGYLRTIQHYWIPKTKLLKGEDDTGAGAKYTEWRDEGWLSICDSAEVDHEEVQQWFAYLAEHGYITAFIGHDRWQSKELCRLLDEQGIEHEPIPQGYALSTALYRLSDELTSETLTWGDNSMTTWMLSNLNVKSDGQGSIKPVKARPTAKIDGAVTLAMAIETYRRHRHELETGRQEIEVW